MGNAANTFSQGAQDVRKVQLPGLPGQLAMSSYLARYRDFTNSNPQAKQVSTGTVTGGTGSGNSVIITVAGITKTYTTTSSDTTTTIIAGHLRDLLNADPILGGIMVATAASNVVYLTGFPAGAAFSVASGTNCTAATTTTAASASPIGFGLAVARTTETTTSLGSLGAGQPASFAALMTDSLFTAQVSTLTFTYAASSVYDVTITILGVPYTFSVTGDTNDNTTAGDMATAITNFLPTGIASAAAVNNVVTITATVGWEFSLAATASLTGNVVIANSVAASIATSAERAFAGVSMWTQNEELTTIGGTVAQYPANAGFKALQYGQIWVTSTQTVAYGDSVWVELDHTSAAAGQFYNSSSGLSKPVQISRGKAIWERTAAYAGSDVGACVLTVNVAA